MRKELLLRIRDKGQQAYAWITGNMKTSVGFLASTHPASIAQKLALPRWFYPILYGHIWKILPLPTLLMTITQEKTIVSQYKMIKRAQYLCLANSDDAIMFPSYPRGKDEITFFVPNNEEGEPSKWAMITPVIACRKKR